MQAIRTRYHGPTNTMGSRISAKAESGTRYFPYDYASVNPHKDAAEAFANSFGWLKDGSTLESGVFGHDYYFVIVRGKETPMCVGCEASVVSECLCPSGGTL